MDDRISQRRANFSRYHNFFEAWNAKGYEIKFQEENAISFANRWLSCILIDPLKNRGLSREKIRLALEEDNIESRPLWKPMHLQPVFQGSQFFGEGVCERLFEIGLCLPSGSNLAENDFERIFKALNQIFSKAQSN